MTDEDGDLIRRCLAGQPEAVHAFAQRWQGPLFGLCYRLLGHRQDAEDVAQDVLWRILRNLKRWDPLRPVKPWLFTIAVNCCRTALAQRARRTRHTDLPADLAEAARSGTTDLADTEELHLALRSLREEHRLCVELFHLQEMSCAEIAEILQCPEATVKTWLHRARRQLAEILQARALRDCSENGPRRGRGS